jgi:hypothetical protein
LGNYDCSLLRLSVLAGLLEIECSSSILVYLCKVRLLKDTVTDGFCYLVYMTMALVKVLFAMRNKPRTVLKPKCELPIWRALHFDRSPLCNLSGCSTARFVFLSPTFESVPARIFIRWRKVQADNVVGCWLMVKNMSERLARYVKRAWTNTSLSSHELMPSRVSVVRHEKWQ